MRAGPQIAEVEIEQLVLLFEPLRAHGPEANRVVDENALVVPHEQLVTCQSERERFRRCVLGNGDLNLTRH